MKPEPCPVCGSDEQTWRDEVDIGVGVQYGPLHCNLCHYNEPSAFDLGEFDVRTA